ncbi:hypothetical protein FC756_25635 [Lysinibacillus mangiferihumi]|uniref:Uncharacterized protein n=1 Tax=Lysinibacillus mangiferihumi TaxID=1130819 RepID=A0A4U2XYV6_9BACI|nr:hypothetical protein [Lysinibacillus mangiferihumi]TKI53130.1 hypothetical protein FC756_25635 [Lysinibacillus mangiferihumi]
MKAILNVKGTKLSVLSIHFRENGQIESVYVNDKDDKAVRCVNEKDSIYNAGYHIALKSLEDSLEFVNLNEKLIKHLDEMIEQEGKELTEIAIEAMEGEPDLPFDNHLSIKQREYKLKQQRVLGWFDAVEEVKAFMEGYYENVDDETITA